jgi:XTP/dITP diphosphohydrolase
MVQLIYGSTNIEKLTEVTRLGGCYDIDMLDLDSAVEIYGRPRPPQIHELEASYEGNAVLKAKAYAHWFNQPCMADDSGLEILQLANLPGVYTARFGVRRVSESLLSGCRYRARFVCCVAYAEPSGRTVSVTSNLLGFISFPKEFAIPSSLLTYSYFFTPEGRGDSLAELLKRDPKFLSHRGLAFTALVESLASRAEALK